MNNFEHILSKHGILISFNLAKKIKPSDIKKIRTELKKTCKDSREINEKLQQMILLEIKNTLNKSDIPGLIQSKKIKNPKIKNPYKEIDDTTKQKLVSISSMANKLIKSEKLSIESILLIIQLILIENKINSEDIKDFNKKYNLKSIESEEYLDNEKIDDKMDDDFDDDFDDDDFDDEDDDGDYPKNY